MYAGKTAAVASNFEGHMDNPYVTNSDCHLYSFLPQGLPMNPQEVIQGVQFINDRKESAINHIEAYQLLIEFHYIAGGFIPELQDLALHEILKDNVFLNKVYKPFPSNKKLWED
jgi:hypothetical protein